MASRTRTIEREADQIAKQVGRLIDDYTPFCDVVAHATYLAERLHYRLAAAPLAVAKVAAKKYSIPS